MNLPRPKAQAHSEEFKRKVINEYLSTGCSKQSLLLKYGIKFKSAIQTWMRIYGYKDTWRNKTIIFIPRQTAILPQDKNDIPIADPAVLLKKIKELERQLEDEQIRSEGYAMMIEIAEKEYKIPIRKKRTTK